MKSKALSKNSSVSREKLNDFFQRVATTEQAKKDSQKRVMNEQLLKVTGGKNIIISNNHK